MLMPLRKVPETASIALSSDSGKLVAPSAERNLGVLCDLLAEMAPGTGTALELASGTGQHVVGYAARLPGLTWQPSEVDATRRDSINVYVSESGLRNVCPAVPLDVTEPGWGANWRVHLVVLSNLLHLISTPEARTVISEAARAMVPGGRFVIYGPFMRAGELTSQGDQSFHASLTGNDPATGYKDDFDVMDWIQEAGLVMCHVVEMPANNLSLVAEKPAT